jgi:diguanylate cyclase (GGDEF)-like protein
MGLTRQITVCLAIGAVVTFTMVGLTTLWMARQHDAEASVATRTMVTGGLNAARHKLEALTNDYAWWDEAYQAYVRSDVEWLDANVGTGITGTEIADALVILSPDGKIVHGWALEGGEPAATIVSPDVIQAVEAATRDVPIDRLAAKTVIARGPSGVLLIGAARITPVSTVEKADRSKLPLMVMAQYLNKERLEELGQSFLLQDLSVESRPGERQDALPLTDENGRTIAQLVWTPPHPGEALLKTAAPPLAIALGIFCAAMIGIGFRARTMALALFDSEKQANTVARRDHLTGLANRLGLTDFLASKPSRDAAGKSELSIIYVDLNGFKQVNDSIGHEGGDFLVCEIARRFERSLPASSYLARVGGDEFVVVLTGAEARNVTSVVKVLPEALDAPFVISGVEFHVSCAVGYTPSLGSEIPAEELIRQADMAMYQAKSTLQREPVAYLSSMETGALEKKQFEGRLWRALQDGELSVAYQPIVSSVDHSVVGLEALIRWFSPELGQVSPAKLVAVAEESGLIRDVGSFVLDRVCADLHRWPGMRVSVNVSPAQLRAPDYVSTFKATLARHGVRPDQIEVELTENVLISNPVAAARKLSQLRRMGVTVALDDFGTGYSSIGSLRNFPFDRVKIDRSFVQGLTTEQSSAALVCALVAVADAMDLEVVAEGVETIEQAQMMRLSGCQFFQGYLISRPVEADKIESLIAKHRSPGVAAPANLKPRLRRHG